MYEVSTWNTHTHTKPCHSTAESEAVHGFSLVLPADSPEPPGSRRQRWWELCSQSQRFPITAIANVQRAPCAGRRTINRQRPLWERKRGFTAPSEGRFSPGHGERARTLTRRAPRGTPALRPAAGNNAAAYSALKTTTVTKATSAPHPPTPSENRAFAPAAYPTASYQHPQGGRAASPFSEPAARTRPERGRRHRLQHQQPTRPAQAGGWVPASRLHGPGRHAASRRAPPGRGRALARAPGKTGPPPAPWGGWRSGAPVVPVHRLHSRPSPSSTASAISPCHLPLPASAIGPCHPPLPPPTPNAPSPPAPRRPGVGRRGWGGRGAASAPPAAPSLTARPPTRASGSGPPPSSRAGGAPPPSLARPLAAGGSGRNGREDGPLARGGGRHFGCGRVCRPQAAPAPLAAASPPSARVCRHPPLSPSGIGAATEFPPAGAAAHPCAQPVAGVGPAAPACAAVQAPQQRPGCAPPPAPSSVSAARCLRRGGQDGPCAWTSFAVWKGAVLPVIYGSRAFGESVSPSFERRAASCPPAACREPISFHSFPAQPPRHGYREGIQQ